MQSVRHKHIDDRRTAVILFLLCWLTYVVSYLGRLNFSACLNEIIKNEGFTKASAGLISTGFFFSYGIGQLASGFLGDRLSSIWMVFLGLLFSSICNIVMFFLSNTYFMVVVWCINGLAQSMLWSPIIRIIAEYYNSHQRARVCVDIAGSPIVGTMLVYASSALIIAAAGWRYAFFTGAAATALMSVLWIFGMKHIKHHTEKHGVYENESECLQTLKTHTGNQTNTLGMILFSGLGWIAVSLMLQGILKEGVTAWVPTYISETFHLDSAISIIGTAVLPLCNLSGVYLSSFAYKYIFKDEISTSCFFFLTGGVCFMLLYFFSDVNVMVSLLILAGATSSMMGVNTMMTSVLPVRFGKFGKSSTISGAMNASVHIGSAISSYGIGSLSAVMGWQKTISVWCICAVLGVALLTLVNKKWAEFQESYL